MAMPTGKNEKPSSCSRNPHDPLEISFMKTGLHIKRWILSFAIGWALIPLSQAAPVFLESFNVQEGSSDQATRLELQFSSEPIFPEHWAIEKPAQIILDLKGTLSHLPQKIQKFDSGLIEKLSFSEHHDQTRAVIKLRQMSPYHVTTDQNQIRVVLDPTPAPQQAPLIESIQFKPLPHHGARIQITWSHANVPIHVEQNSQKISIQLSGAQLPKHLQQKLDVTDFGSPVQLIQTEQKKGAVQMDVHLMEEEEHFSYQTEQGYVLEIKPLSQDKTSSPVSSEKIYSGKRVSFNFQDIEIRSVLQLLGDFTGLNIIANDSVQGKITLRLHNVPWDEALALILKSKGLDQRQSGNVLLIAPQPELLARDKQTADANLQSSDITPLTTEFVPINYAKATELSSLIKDDKNSMLSSRGRLSVDTRTNTLILRDTIEKIEQIRSLIRKLDVAVEQVQIEARVVEVKKNFEDALGIRWGLTGTQRRGSSMISTSGTLEAADQVGLTSFFDHSVAGAAGSGSSSGSNTAMGNRLNLALPLPNTLPNTGKLGLAIARLPGGTILDLELSALQSENFVNLISSPRLITANQSEATIEQGQEIPYQESTSSGATNIAFKKAVLSLKVTPQITPDRRIILSLEVHNDGKSTDTVANVPVIDTNQIKTAVLVENGQTLVLGGIYKRDQQNNMHRIPFLSQIPLFGRLFRDQDQIDNRDEIIVFITPKIMGEQPALG